MLRAAAVAHDDFGEHEVEPRVEGRRAEKGDVDRPERKPSPDGDEHEGRGDADDREAEPPRKVLLAVEVGASAGEASADSAPRGDRGGPKRRLLSALRAGDGDVPGGRGCPADRASALRTGEVDAGGQSGIP
jgi:hypothetical protein